MPNVVVVVVIRRWQTGMENRVVAVVTVHQTANGASQPVGRQQHPARRLVRGLLSFSRRNKFDFYPLGRIGFE